MNRFEALTLWKIPVQLAIGQGDYSYGKSIQTYQPNYNRAVHQAQLAPAYSVCFVIHWGLASPIQPAQTAGFHPSLSENGLVKIY